MRTVRTRYSPVPKARNVGSRWGYGTKFHMFQMSATYPVSFSKFCCICNLPTFNFYFFSTLMWSIWKNKNNKVWNVSSDTCQVICDRATTLLQSWRNAQEVKQQGCMRINPSHVATCTKPSPGRYKCNVDASFSETLDIVGIGMCITDA